MGVVVVSCEHPVAITREARANAGPRSRSRASMVNLRSRRGSSSNAHSTRRYGISSANGDRVHCTSRCRLQWDSADPMLRESWARLLTGVVALLELAVGVDELELHA